MSTTETITLNRILTNAASWHASDMHFVLGSQPLVRVDGKLLTMEDEAIFDQAMIEAIVNIFLTPTQRQQLEEKKEIVVGFSLNQQLRFKVNTFFQRGSIAMSLHFIDANIKRLSELGLPAAVQGFANLTKGLLLVTGPYGSGRTTTMNAIVDQINQQRNANIVTIEQPIEYLFVNNKSVIEQREVGRDALSYEQAITTASREDVDVIVVSEVHGFEVIAAMLDAAESSRLVISTMNTDSVLSTIEKILNSFPADDAPKVRVQLASALAGIVSQRLLPRIGGGQVAVAEVLVPTDPVRAVLRDGALFQLSNVLLSSREAGTVSYDRSLADLVRAGQISIDDAMRHAHDPNALQALSR